MNPWWYVSQLIMPVKEVSHLLKRVVSDALCAGYLWACRAVNRARSSCSSTPTYHKKDDDAFLPTELEAGAASVDRLSALARALDVRAFEHCDGRSPARLEAVSRTFRTPRDDAFRGQSLRYSLSEASAWRTLITSSEASEAPKLTFGNFHSCAWKTRILDRYCALRDAGGLVSSVDRYVYLDAVLAKERPEVEWQGLVNGFHVVHRIAQANPGPIPVDVQTAIFYASRDRKQETSYFAGLSNASTALLNVSLWTVCIRLTEYLLEAVIKFGDLDRRIAHSYIYSEMPLFSFQSLSLFICVVMCWRCCRRR